LFLRSCADGRQVRSARSECPERFFVPLAKVTLAAWLERTIACFRELRLAMGQEQQRIA
jgi:hypothetical protein